MLTLLLSYGFTCYGNASQSRLTFAMAAAIALAAAFLVHHCVAALWAEVACGFQVTKINDCGRTCV